GDAFWTSDPQTQQRLEVLLSNTAYPNATADAFDQFHGTKSGYAVRGAWHRTLRDWTFHADYNDVSDDFRPHLGFIPQVGYRKAYGFVEHYLYGDAPDHRRWYSKWAWGTESTWTYDSHGHPLQNQVAPYFFFNGPRQSSANVYLGLGPSWY